MLHSVILLLDIVLCILAFIKFMHYCLLKYVLNKALNKGRLSYFQTTEAILNNVDTGKM